jgi:hypothetical protein
VLCSIRMALRQGTEFAFPVGILRLIPIVVGVAYKSVVLCLLT